MTVALNKLTAGLSDVRRATSYRYSARDDKNVTLDCLKPCPLGPNDFLAVHHSWLDGRFFLRLVHSTNLMDWRHVATLSEHASQGELHRMADGSFWLAYEHDEPNSTFIRLRRFANRKQLEAGRFSGEITLGRTLAPTAEGTPSFEKVSDKEINLRFHFYRNGDVDRAAKGTLTGLAQWKTEPDARINQIVEAFGVRGNIGGRSRFTHQNQNFYVQEGQLTKNDWASWRVFLMDDARARRAVPFPIQTHRNSRSFCNPSIVALDTVGRPNEFLVSAFLPSEGNAPGEIGELIYVVRLP